MVLKLYGSPQSTCVRRALVVGKVAGVPVELQSVEFTSIYTAEWQKNQPFNQMPYLIDTDTGLELYESRAISRYIASKSANKAIFPRGDNDAHWKFEVAASVEQNNFDPSASGLGAELVFIPAAGGKTDDGRVKKLTELLAKRLEGYERILSKQKYIAGDNLTIVDLFHLPYGSMVVDLKVAPGLTDGSLPNVTRWWKELASLPEWAAVQPK